MRVYFEELCSWVFIEQAVTVKHSYIFIGRHVKDSFAMSVQTMGRKS